MRTMIPLTLAALGAWSAISTSSPVAAELPKPGTLDWIAGYWLNCDGQEQTAEVWIGAGSGLLVGATHAMRADGASYEHGRIARQADGRLAFYASPGGAPEVAFPLVALEGQRATFENPAHDFPQRVIYSREGKVLTGRIEGTAGGKDQSMEWRYRGAQLGDTCS